MGKGIGNIWEKAEVKSERKLIIVHLNSKREEGKIDYRSY